MIGEKGSDLIRGCEPLPPVTFAHEKNDQRRRARQFVI